MEKLYTQERWATRSARYANITFKNQFLIQKSVINNLGKVITYDYYATGELISHSLCKKVARIALGWLLAVATFGYLSYYQRVRAWMHGRRVDRIYIVHQNQPPIPHPPHQEQPFLPHVQPPKPPILHPPHEEMPVQPHVKPSQGKPEHRRPTPDIHLSNMLTRTDIPIAGYNDALQILKFSDKNQDVVKILEEYFCKNNHYPGSPKDTIQSIIKVLEQSLGLKFGQNEQDDRKILAAFLERVFRRVFHGTSKIAAKSIIQNGISYQRAVKGYDYDELDFLIDNCHLHPSGFYERRRKNEDGGDACGFFVSDRPGFAHSYVKKDKGPEWFVKLRLWGEAPNGTFDPNKFKMNIKNINPDCTDVDRVIRFVKKHWDICAPNKKNGAILIVEKDKVAALPELYHAFPLDEYPQPVPKSDFKSSIEWFAKEIQKKAHSDRNVLESLLYKVLNCPCYAEQRLGANNTKKPPKLINAIKVPVA